MPEEAHRHAQAAADFNEHEQRADGLQILGDLTTGFRQLSDLFFTRIHADVERRFGLDSMLAPISEAKSEHKARNEIALFFIAESAACIRDRGYLADPDGYVKWLGRLRLGEGIRDPKVVKRLATYRAREPAQRRQTFASLIERVFPEATRAPVVLFRLLPLAVTVVTASTFGDIPTAHAARRDQVAVLPLIADCRDCRGDVKEIGEQCPKCGNPLWTYEWLTAE